jgi:hypothetical protein
MSGSAQRLMGVMMSDSIVFYHSRDGHIYIIDPDNVPHHNDMPPILEICASVLNAGYKGIAIDERRLANGRYFHVINSDMNTPEGVYINELVKLQERMEELPACEDVIRHINQEYEMNGDIDE